MQAKIFLQQRKAKIYKYRDHTGAVFLTAKLHTILCFTKVIQCLLLAYERQRLLAEAAVIKKASPETGTASLVHCVSCQNIQSQTTPLTLNLFYIIL